MDSLSLSMVVIGYCQMGYYVFQGNIMKQTSSFMLIWILIWSAIGVMDWLRGQNVIIIVIYMDFGDLSLSPMCVWSIIEGIWKIEREIEI